MLLAAPKKRPEFERSLRDLNEVLKYNSDNVHLRLLMLKGCQCDFPEFDNAMKNFNDNYPHLKIQEFIITGDEKQRDYNQDFVNEMYQAIDYLYKRPDWVKPAKLKKHYLINGYYYAMAKYLFQKTKTDLFIYLEDDQTYNHELIQKLVEYYNSTNFDNYCFEKVTPYTFSKIPPEPNTSYLTRQWGHYGLVRTRKQMAEFFRIMKFQRYFESGDALSGYFCKGLFSFLNEQENFIYSMSSDSENEYDFTRHKREEFKFKGFRQLLKEMTVSSIHDVYNSERQQKSLGDTHSYTYDALMKWKDDDRTESFHNAFYSLRQRATTLPLLIINLDDIMNTLLFHLQIKDSLAIHSLLDITTQVIRDVRDLFMPYIPKILEYCKNKLIGCTDTSTIYDIFNTISFMIKYLHSVIMEHSDMFIQHYIYFLCHKKDYVRTFASESMVYLLHKMSPQEFIQFVDNIISLYIVSDLSKLSVSEKNFLIRGIGSLLFENIKGVKNQLIVKNKFYIELYFDKLINDTSQTSEIWYQALLICNKSISIQKREGFDEYFVLLKNALPEQPKNQECYGKILAIVIRWVMYRYGKTIETCENDVEEILKYTFKCTKSTEQHLESIPLLAENSRFADVLYESVSCYIKYLSNEELRRLMAETTKQVVYFTMVLKELIKRNDIDSLHKYFPLRFIPTLWTEDCDLLTQHFTRFPVSLINDLAQCFNEKELTDDYCSFIAATGVASLITNVKEKAINYFDKSPIPASVVLAHFDNPIEDKIITYLKNLKTSQYLFALAYYVQQRKIVIELSNETKHKLMKFFESKYSLERSAAGFLLVNGDERRSREIMSIMNDIEINLSMIRGMLARIDYMKSRALLGSTELREMMVHFSLGMLQVKLLRLWDPSKDLIKICVQKDPQLIEIVIQFINEFNNRNEHTEEEEENEEDNEKIQTDGPLVFSQYSLSLTDSHTISNYLWEIILENVDLIKEGKYHEWFINQFITRYEQVDVAVLNKKEVETLTHYVNVLAQIHIPEKVVNILMKLLTTTKIELQIEIFNSICSTDSSINKYKKEVCEVVNNLHKTSQLRNSIQRLSIKGKALSLLCRMLFVHIVQKAVEKSVKKILIEFISQIEDDVRIDFLNDTMEAFFEFVQNKKRFNRGELDYILHTLHIINSAYGSFYGSNDIIGKLLLQIIQKDPSVTWDVLRLIIAFSQSAADGNINPNQLFDFKVIYSLVIDKHNLKLSEFIGETLMVLPNANEYLHSIPKLVSYLYQYNTITSTNVHRLLELYLMTQDMEISCDCSNLVKNVMSVILPNFDQQYVTFMLFILPHTTLNYNELLSAHISLTNELLLPVIKVLSNKDESMAILAQSLIKTSNSLIEQHVLPEIFNCELGNKLIPLINSPLQFFNVLKSTDFPTGKLLLFVEEYACQVACSNNYQIGEISTTFLLALYKQTKIPTLIPRLINFMLEHPTLPIANLLTNCIIMNAENELYSLASNGFFKALVKANYIALDKTKEIISTLKENELDLVRRLVGNAMEIQEDKKTRIKFNDIIGLVYNQFEWSTYEHNVMLIIDFLKDCIKKRTESLGYLEEAQANERKEDIRKYNKIIEEIGKLTRVRFIELRAAIFNFHFDIGGEFDVKELNNFAIIGDLPFEITDQNEETLQMTQQRIIRQSVILRIIPGLSELMQDKHIGNKKSDIVRMLVELLCRLPEDMKRLQLPQMIQLIVNEFHEKTFELREIARKQLVEILWKLGDSYFADVVDELYNGLHKGFMKHVLGYTIEFLLRSICDKVYEDTTHETKMEEEEQKEGVDEDLEEEQENQMVEDFSHFNISGSIETLLKIVYDDLTGPVAEQREIGKIRNEIVEARECKSFLTFGHIGKLVEEVTTLDRIIEFIKDDLRQTKKLHEALEMDRLLRECEKGLNENKFLTKEQLYHYGISVVQKCYYVPQLKDILIIPKIKLAGQKAKERIMFKKEKNALEMMDNGVIDKQQHYHILVEFGLKLVVDSIECISGNDDLLSQTEEIAKKCCLMKNERSIMLAVKILRTVLKKRNRMDEGYSIGCKIIQSLQKTDTELYSQALLFMTDIIKRCDEKFNPKDFETVLNIIVTNIQDSNKNTANFLFLNSVMKKGIIHPTLYDVMLDYGKLMMQSSETKIRKESQELLITFLTKYPLSKSQYKMYVEFFIKNIDFKEPESRCAIADLLYVVIDRMDAKDANEGINYIYIPIILRVSIEDYKKAQTKQIKVLKTFIMKISKEQMNKIISMNNSWMKNQKGSIRKVGWIGNCICVNRLKKTKDEYINKIKELYSKEQDNVQEEMVRFCMDSECCDQQIFEEVMTTPSVNGVAEYLLTMIDKIQNYQKVIEIAVQMVVNNNNVIEWTKITKNIIEQHTEMIVKLMSILGNQANESSVKMVASLIGIIEKDENYINLIVQYLLPIASSKDKPVALLAQEVLNIVKTFIDPEKYLSLIQKD
ncbi:hypothetical protein, conserved [Entamoeba histolytica HM-1:IMSS]|uniref:U3 small nucleolar RNA-associated protein 20 domain-containing protein n=3 Tax=Entamoeba histolytica TaxID=5759 RepID=C4LT45_ENTH1|nr:hypothetical protein, conserved [Entamoeba histolytica HM-1:IMSS]EAL52077.2 hypothetical protein, conserved [Entamoeba histolytica HM-1:IMSS]ENY62652.1 hypothetical protein EHI7A_056620 [Entamoeba histolytica HM-1:IMSS-A]|eukprot:XP_657463.2 hypothetical protein, conserved [Entamoeba histolytica HM-1:IMSS]